jgi:lysophospholipase L1-like esterase
LVPVGLAAVLALGGGAADSGASGSPAPAPAVGPAAAATGKLTIGVWPSPARVGHEAVVEIGERGAKRGDSVVECVNPPSGKGGPHCSSVVLGPGGRASTRFAAKRLGAWSVSVIAGGERSTKPVEVVPGRLRVLATGDSEIQLLDDILASDLAPKGARLSAEAHISTGISKPLMFDWVKRAAVQAAGLHPDITVMFIGANDGFPLPAGSGSTSYCCGQAWVDAFAKRTESMMASYLRGGAGRVYWFTLPSPRSAAAQPVFRAINRAFAIAGASFASGVELIDLVPVFTPGGRYRQNMTYGGRTVDVREPDGYHLSLGGDAIAASILIGRMRADGLIR